MKLVMSSNLYSESLFTFFSKLINGVCYKMDDGSLVYLFFYSHQLTFSNYELMYSGLTLVHSIAWYSVE